jgi:hypothetical protein
MRKAVVNCLTAIAPVVLPRVDWGVWAPYKRAE